MDRQPGDVEEDAAQPPIFAAGKVVLFVGRDEERLARADERADVIPVEPLVDQKEHGVGRRGAEQAHRRLEEMFELRWEVSRAHGAVPCRRALVPSGEGAPEEP